MIKSADRVPQFIVSGANPDNHMIRDYELCTDCFNKQSKQPILVRNVTNFVCQGCHNFIKPPEQRHPFSNGIQEHTIEISGIPHMVYHIENIDQAVKMQRTYPYVFVHHSCVKCFAYMLEEPARESSISEMCTKCKLHDYPPIG